MIRICDDQAGIDECKASGMPCIAFDPKGVLHHDWILESFEGLDMDFVKKAYCRQRGIPLKILETKRTYLREFAMDDLDDLFKLYATPHTTDYIEPLYEYDEERDYQEKYIKNIYGFYDYGIWLVCDKETGRIIGRAGVESREDVSEDEVEMGYVIAYERRGQGLASEVCTAIIDWVRNNLEVSYISCQVHRDNAASIALLKRLGFSIGEPDPVSKMLRASLWVGERS